MPVHARRPVPLYLLLLAGIAVLPACRSAPGRPASVQVVPAPTLQFRGANSASPNQPGDTDCNSPAHWEGGTLFLFNSSGHPWRSAGPDLHHLTNDYRRVEYNDSANGGRWIESTLKARDGRLYGWYHFEPAGLCPGQHPEAPNMQLTAPKIGAVRSADNGATWENLGIVLESPRALDCGTSNYYFAGGNGDFCVLLDPGEQYLYFFFSTYVGATAEQGVGVARMEWKSRDDPVGQVRRWHQAAWSQPGIGGESSPIFAARANWHQSNPDAFWGPSIHWNTYLRQYVMLLNRAVDSRWKQEGIYLSFAPSLDKPNSWSVPYKIVDSPGPDRWYPQVIGLNSERRETDKLAGRRARLFVRGESRWELLFHRASAGPGLRP